MPLIVISCSLDSSFAEAKERGTLKAHRERYQLFTKFDKVALLTQDNIEFTSELKPLTHIAAAHSKVYAINNLLSKRKLLRWSYFSFSTFFWLTKNRKNIRLLIAENVDSPTPFIFTTIFRIPYFIHYHYDVATQVKNINKNTIVGILLIFLEKLCFKRATRVWVTAENLASKATKFGVSKITLIPNWIDFNETPRNLRTQINQTKKILFVGRLHKVKRVSLLIQALAELKRNCPNVTLKIVGDGEERQSLVNLTHNLGLEKSVEFLGFQDHDKVIKLMQESDLFVLPSEMEGNPRVLMEAMILKVPIVATDVFGIRDMVRHGETGYLVKVPQPLDLAEGMRYVLENREYAIKISEKAYEFAESKFSKGQVLEKITADISAVLAQH